MKGRYNSSVSVLKKEISVKRKGGRMSKLTDKDKIVGGKWVNCWICEDVFRRRRETARYCIVCEKGFCEGEHGTFAQKGVGKCIVCGAK